MPMSPFIFIPRTALKTDMPPEISWIMIFPTKLPRIKEKVDEMDSSRNDQEQKQLQNLPAMLRLKNWYDSWYQKLNDTAHSNQ